MTESQNKAFYENGKIYVVFDGGLFASGSSEDPSSLEWIGDFDSGFPVGTPEHVLAALQANCSEIAANRRAADKLAYEAIRGLSGAQKEAVRARLGIKFEMEWFS